MTFQKVESEKLSKAVVRQIEQLILRGILRPNERLPSERELSERLGVSRPSLREAIAELQASGLVVSRAGAGIFVADVLGSAFSPALIKLFASDDEAVFDYLSFRRDLEGLAAERAARVGSDADLQVIQTIFNRMEAAGEDTPASESAELDAQFHSAILEASHNVVMLHMMRSMFDLLLKGVFYNRNIMFGQHVSYGAILDQHGQINDAIQRRAPADAKRAVEFHLDYVKSSLEDSKRAERNAEIAAQKLEHEKERD